MQRARKRDWQRAKRASDPDYRANDRAAQRAWLKARDPACRLLLKEDEGYTIWPSEFDNCRAEASRERTAQLRTWKTSLQK